MKVFVDESAGFCFGVVKAIETAEKQLAKQGSLLCLGQMVHNESEMSRLKQIGLKTIQHTELSKYSGRQVLIRAHGEPPETYRKASENQVSLVEATCPIVLTLQQRIAKHDPDKVQIVIFGKKNHPETIGLNGQTYNRGVIIESENDLEKIDFSKDVVLYSQTTMDYETFENLKRQIQHSMSANASFKSKNTICGQMKRRKPALIDFVKQHDVVLFVSGKHSSNGRFLFQAAKQYQPKTYMIGTKTDIDPAWLKGAEKIGVSGATSTPAWLLQEIAQHVKTLMA
ncbi:MAG: 4-hydroxy-3-methylbut-2-enyl diphosphate reductase [Bacteroidota bacterium]